MNFNDNKSIYLQIADQLLENILAKELEGGDRIASVREMASHTQVNPNTIMRTYNYLLAKEIVFNKRGIGYFIAIDAFEKARAIKKKVFVEEQLPNLFKMMDLLDISMSELKALKKEITIKN